MKQITIKKKVYNPKWWQRLLFWKLFSSYTIQVPEAWDEVAKADFLRVYTATLKEDEGERWYETVKAILPSSIRDEAHYISTRYIVKISQLMDFANMVENKNYLPHRLLTNPPIQSFGISIKSGLHLKNQILSLPGKELEHITCRNFRDAVAAYNQVQNHEKGIDKLIQAILDTDIDYNILLRKLKFPVIHMIIRYFTDSLTHINHTITQLSSSFISEDGPDNNGVDFGWDGVFMEVAKDGVFGTYQEILDTSFHTVLIYTIKKYEDALKQKRELEKMNDAN